MVFGAKIAFGAAGFEQLTLEIAAKQHAFLPMEPIFITITLSNKTNATIMGHTVIEQGTDFLEIYVATKEGEPFKKWREASLVVPSMERFEGCEIKPGYKKQVTAKLYGTSPPSNIAPEKYDPNEIIKCYLLPYPGTYRIKATLKNISGKGIIESNVITIEAIQPAGQDAAAYDFLKTISHPLFLTSSFSRHSSKYEQKVLAKQEDFLSQFPDSHYSRYMSYSLGLTYVAKKGEYINDGIQLLEKVGIYEDFWLAEDALKKLVEISMKKEQYEKAKGYLEILKRRFPDNLGYLEEAGKLGKLISNSKE